MIWLALLVSTFFVVATATALRPAHRGPLSILAFTVGWPAGELAGVTFLAQLTWVAFMYWWGVPRHLAGHLWWAEVIFVEMGCLILMASWLLARRKTRRDMVTSGPFPLDPAASRPDRFSRWWRTLVILPFRSRDIHVVRNLKYGDHQRHRLDIMSTTTSGTNRPVLFYIHGGAWVYGNKREQARPMMFEFARRGWLVVAINYRLSPTNRWPAQIEDARQALTWVKRTVSAYGGDPQRVVVSGGSAGGHLASLLALIGNSDEWRPSLESRTTDLTVQGCVSIYGVLDMTGDRATWRNHDKGLRVLLEQSVMGEKIAHHPELFELASPLHRISSDAPPFLLLQGTSDTLVDFNVARTFADRYRSIKGPGAPLWHVELPMTQHAYDLSHSPRTTATTRAAVTFAQWAVAHPSPAVPPVPASLAVAYQVPPTDLRIAVDEQWRPAREVAATFGRLFVVTPFNPLSELLDEAHNELLLAQLQREVTLRGWTWRPSEGRDPSSTEWREEGVALADCTLEQARSLALRYRQYAFYEVTAEEVIVRSSATGDVVR